ncbi:putative zinc-binding metallopeptidase [Bordetella genomosp. 13]|uniref:zinc-binding metallopeptidase family protein n=1 Tax=Bordetella genomosp. 13 TaxID=463040 RepID=UPI0021B6C41D|nr:putative zinc-binding metallopeptidase [Bordetella genomosp. 13]
MDGMTQVQNLPMTFSSATKSRPRETEWTPRAYQCACGRRIFFRNTQCLACKASLGYVASRRTVYPLLPGPGPQTWRIVADEDGDSRPYRRCANFATAAACNWLLEPGEGHAMHFCRSCRLNRTIPDLSQARNPPLWLGMERAKRRLVSQLIGLGLPVASKVSEDPRHGLAYDFLCNAAGQPRVMTGHADGIITINLEEADDAARERIRIDMGEPYRTLLGHFRHEVGHYYWDRLVRDKPWQQDGRRLFGDERQDYRAALDANYASGPPADWRLRYVSAYASIHPYEDWAETWAHYLHLRDTLDTAVSYGIAGAEDDDERAAFGPVDLWRRDLSNGLAFLDILNRWVRITSVMNEMSRAMGQHDFYPFVLPHAAVAKLHFIHCVVSQDMGGAPALEARA